MGPPDCCAITIAHYSTGVPNTNHDFFLVGSSEMKPTASNPPSMQDDDAPDEWDQRILNTGCYEENLALQLCHADEGDWRKCLGQMAAFRKCWDANKNNERTHTVDEK